VKWTSQQIRAKHRNPHTIHKGKTHTHKKKKQTIAGSTLRQNPETQARTKTQSGSSRQAGKEQITGGQSGK